MLFCFCFVNFLFCFCLFNYLVFVVIGVDVYTDTERLRALVLGAVGLYNHR